MHKVISKILFVVLVLLSFVSFGQDDYYETDTLVRVTTVDQTDDRTDPSFSEITQKEQAKVRKVPEQKVNELKSKDEYWYANFEPEKKEKKVEKISKEKGLLDQEWFKNLLWIIILCSFIGVVIWYLASSNISIFRKEPKKINEPDAEEMITDDIFNINYEREIQKAVEASNFRLAVRLWYLKTLKELSERNIIDYRHERTNNDYVNSLYGSRYYRDFFRLTRNFEYTWYGQFNLSAEAYEMMRTDFSNFKNSLS